MASEVKRKEKEAWWLSKLLGVVEGGLTELQGHAFAYEDIDHHTLDNKDQRSNLPVGMIDRILYTNKTRAYVAPHVELDITTDKEKALRRILVRLRQVSNIPSLCPILTPPLDLFLSNPCDVILTHRFDRLLSQIEGVNAPGDRRDIYFCSDQDTESYLASFGELAEMVEWVWSVYAPGGQLLSK